MDNEITFFNQFQMDFNRILFRGFGYKNTLYRKLKSRYKEWPPLRFSMRTNCLQIAHRTSRQN